MYILAAKIQLFPDIRHLPARLFLFRLAQQAQNSARPIWRFGNKYITLRRLNAKAMKTNYLLEGVTTLCFWVIETSTNELHTRTNAG